MSTFLSYAVPGVPFGCTYAIVAMGLVLTYRTTGVFNFAFGAQAFVSAFTYTVLVGRGVGVWPAFVLSVVVLAPALGWVLDRFLFRRIAPTNTTAKLVSAVAVFVALPELVTLIFGSATRFSPPTLFMNPSVVYFHLFSTPINGLEFETVIVTVMAVVVVNAVLHSRVLGLTIRAAVESPRLLQLEGVRSDRVLSATWMGSSLMAGLAGVLLAPQYPTLQFNDYAVLLVAALAAAALGNLANVPLALVGGIALGVVEGLGSGYFPSSSVWHTGLLPAIPFLLLAVLLVARGRLRGLEVSDDPLSGVDPPPPMPITATRGPELDRVIKLGGRALAVGAVASVLTWVPGNWAFTLTTGLVYSIIFLSITLVTGMGGEVSLCQATFAGVGAFIAAQLAVHHGVPILLGAVIGALGALGVGALGALPALRLRGLPLALLTLALALLADNAVFPYSWAGGPATGLEVPRPQIGSVNLATTSSKGFFVLALVVLIVCAIGVKLVQRATVGRYLDALRASPIGAESVGINPSAAKVFVFALSAGLAGLGGALYASLQQSITPADFNYQFSLIFVVVVVTTGVRTVEGAIQAGVGFVVVQQLLSYLPGRWGSGGLAVVFFAFAALTYAAHPEGVVEYEKRVLTQRFERRLNRGGPSSGEIALAATTSADRSSEAGDRRG
jgi:branched-subunit amino acid ABC-type transport system permease component